MPFGNMTITITYNSSLLYNQMDRLSSRGTYIYASIHKRCMFVWWCCKITLTIYWRKMFYILLELAQHQMGGGDWDNPFGCIANISILLKFHFFGFCKPMYSYQKNKRWIAYQVLSHTTRKPQRIWQFFSTCLFDHFDWWWLWRYNMVWLEFHFLRI